MPDITTISSAQALPNMGLLRCQLAKRPAIPLFRTVLKTLYNTLAERFRNGDAIAELVHLRAQMMDEIITTAWEYSGLPSTEAPDIALLAVGGYGRGELLPHSDIDLWIVMAREDSTWSEALSTFIMLLWDIGLKPGHCVRTLADCERLAEEDLTVISALLESRRLTGSVAVFDALHELTLPSRMWHSHAFYVAKLEEQRRRHGKLNHTESLLEPNIKDSPGGLRDLHTIAWVALQIGRAHV